VHEGVHGVHGRGSGTRVDAFEAWRVLVCTRGAGTDRRAQVVLVTGCRATSMDTSAGAVALPRDGARDREEGQDVTMARPREMACSLSPCLKSRW
jgi:hypothetical protein